jgi:outer membrane protein TolC
MSRRSDLAASARLSALCVAALSLAMANGCQRDEEYPFEPRALGQLQRDASKNQATGPMAPLPTSYEPWIPKRRRPATTQPATHPFDPIVTGNEPTEQIGLEEIIHRTVAHNLDVRAAGYGPAIEGTRILEAISNYDPVFFSSIQADVIERSTGGGVISNPSTGSVESLVPNYLNKSDDYTAIFGLKQNLESGGQASIQYQLKETHNVPATTILNPYREADLILQLTQPLLRDFGGEANKARIDLARNSQRQSLLDFRKATEEAVFNVEQSYWQLWTANEGVRILEEATKQADADVSVLGERFADDTNLSELAQAQAEADSRRASLLRQKARLRDLSDQIKVLMNDPDYPVADATVLLTKLAPLDKPVRFDLDELVNTALEHRYELGQQQFKVDAATITKRAAVNNLLPKLDFKGSVNPMGLSAGSFEGAVSNQTDFNRISYSLGLQFEVPLGNREAESIYRRTLLQVAQAISTYHSLVEQVAADVKIKHRDVETTWQEVIYYRKARLRQEKALETLESQVRLGNALDPFTVRNKLDTELRLADARIQETTALGNYNIAIAALERSKGTLLKYNNITLEEEGTGALSK